MDMGKAKGFIIRNRAAIVLIALSAIIYHRWLSFGIFSFADYLYRFPESLTDYGSLTVWRSGLGLGTPNLSVWMIIFDAFTAWAGRFSGGSNVADKLTVFWPFVFITPVAAYALARHMLKSQAASFVAALAYAFNTYFLAINTQGHFSLSVAGSFVPLVLLFFIRSMETASRTDAVLASLSMLAIGSYDFRVAYVTAGILLIYVPFFVLSEGEGLRKPVRRICGNLLAFGSLLLSFNLFWIIPFAKMGSLAENSVLSRGIINFYLDIPRAFSLTHPFWTGAEPVWFEPQPIPAWNWLIPILAVSGLWLLRKNRNVVFFGLVALFGIILSKQTSAPFGDLYYWLHRHLPGFSAFREASKFYFLIALGYSVLIGAFVAGISKRFPKRRILHVSAFVLASGLFLWNARSVIDGRMESIFVPRQVSEDEAKLRMAVNGGQEFSRTLFVPLNSDFTTFSSRHPRIDAAEMEKTAWARFGRNPGQGGEEERTDRIRSILLRPYADNLLDESAIRYVVVPEKNAASWVPTLEAAGYLVPAGIGTNGMVVFRNDGFRPHLYLTERPETVQQRQPFDRIEFSALGETEYLVRIRRLSSLSYLDFSEAYHPSWRISPAGYGWLSDILGRTPFLAADGHAETDAGLSAFRLDPDEIKTAFPEGSYRRNPDGSLDIDLRLVFVPQGWLQVGLIVSGTALAASLAYLVIAFKRRHNGRHGKDARNP